ncbi:MAG: nucleotide exchange factor GrpE [Defluviitaleaceae bacterium]|nr:nucleotide exchange factor GrpE [Defluviitaleaceae bacterium]
MSEEVKEAPGQEKEVMESQKEATPEERLKEKLEEKLKEKLEQLEDKLMRNMAEFDNYRKRTTKEKTSMYDMGIKDTVEKLLPIVDNFERATQNLNSDNDLHKGILMIYRQLEVFLSDIGLSPIDCLGQPFDPNLHNAVSNESDPSKPPNTVLAELQRGYTYKEKVVRHSMVKVNIDS